MSGIIHMEPEKVRQQAKSLSSVCGEMETLLDSMFNQVIALPWEGGASHEFKLDIKSLRSKLQSALQEGGTIALRMEREIDEWIGTDQRSAATFASITSILLVPIKISEFIAGSFYKSGFELWWLTLSQEQKLKYLQDEMDKVAEKLGFPPVPIKFEELEDPEGKDSMGHYDPSSKSIVLDKGDIDTFLYNPSQILNTMVHETRHAYQDYCVEYLATNSIPPDGITSEQVIEWRDNMNNYIVPADDFEGYQGQPIEVDARDWAKEYLNEKFLGAG